MEKLVVMPHALAAVERYAKNASSYQMPAGDKNMPQVDSPQLKSAQQHAKVSIVITKCEDQPERLSYYRPDTGDIAIVFWITKTHVF